MPPKYKTTLLKQVKVGKATKTSYQVTKKGNIKVNEIKAILATLTKGNTDTKIMIRGLNADKWNTLKGYSTDLNIADFEDYYQNKVSDTSKFDYFTQLEISVFK